MTGGCSGGGRVGRSGGVLEGAGFFLLAKRKGICSSCAVFRLPGEVVGGGGGGRLQGGLFPASLGDLFQICAE